MSVATRVQSSISKTTEKIMPKRLFDSASPRASELPSAPARPASEQSPQYSRAIIPGDDPGDQQPPKSTPVPVINGDRSLHYTVSGCQQLTIIAF
jgi:hypothetical protein